MRVLGNFEYLLVRPLVSFKARKEKDKSARNSCIKQEMKDKNRDVETVKNANPSKATKPLEIASSTRTTRRDSLQIINHEDFGSLKCPKIYRSKIHQEVHLLLKNRLISCLLAPSSSTTENYPVTLSLQVSSFFIKSKLPPKERYENHRQNF